MIFKKDNVQNQIIFTEIDLLLNDNSLYLTSEKNSYS